MGKHIVIPVEELELSMKLKYSASNNHAKDDKVEKNEEEIAITGDKTECRFCQEEDFIIKMEAPCFCNGTLKYAHRSCIQRWCNIKGGITCEICGEPPLLLAEIATEVTDRVAAALNDDCNFHSPSGGVICGTGLLLFLTLLILRDAYYYAPPKEDKLFHTLFCVMVVILAPFYIMSWFYECR
ncbi:hypothetical protein L6164_007482 [Bauhinia variegata]|uniref:Uncharacterized protein n=1 Tax=Bauhinia variegata TaxID=167791 RepID=A0ACB9PD01_BAUVA|nr:hypothetical protein L6164_007482 [Bauhinia variegata]